MNEEDYWSALEYRVGEEMSGVEEHRRLGMWCDGLIANTFDLESEPACISGRAWVCFHSRQEEWTFDLLLPASGSTREQIDWAQLLPTDDATGWLSVDLKRKHLVVTPGGAIDFEQGTDDEDAIPQ